MPQPAVIRAKGIVNALRDENTSVPQTNIIIADTLGYKPGIEDPEPSEEDLARRYVQLFQRISQGQISNVRVADVKSATPHQDDIDAAEASALVDIPVEPDP